MIAAFALYLLAAAAGASAPAAADNEIVVTATPGKCRMDLSRRPVSDRALSMLAADWPKEKPIRVVVPSGANQNCLTHIMFQLTARGFRLVEFVHPRDDRDPGNGAPQPSAAPPPPTAPPPAPVEPDSSTLQWRACVLAAATRWAGNRETADVVAAGAMGSCRAREPQLVLNSVRRAVEQEAIAKILERRSR